MAISINKRDLHCSTLMPYRRLYQLTPVFVDPVRPTTSMIASLHSETFVPGNHRDNTIRRASQHTSRSFCQIKHQQQKRPRTERQHENRRCFFAPFLHVPKWSRSDLAFLTIILLSLLLMELFFLIVLLTMSLTASLLSLSSRCWTVTTTRSSCSWWVPVDKCYEWSEAMKNVSRKDRCGFCAQHQLVFCLQSDITTTRLLSRPLLRLLPKDQRWQSTLQQ